ncbi:hypothetical protein AURDEDRAFT_150950 [Auricularia subglabra TFB-10046 SS5]|nr:hypothetical protein AURDEDRAFT_150950 [Auricularia subglabra TFB-10046 SS5]
MSTATLLHSSVLSPTGDSGLCSIRFSTPVRVSKIRIHDDDRTQPESFVLDVYLNCQLVPTPAEPRPKPTNALVPTRIVHPASGTRDFFVNMTPEYTTKLMIIKGDVTSLHVSVYGTVHAPGSTDPAPYVPRASTSSATSDLQSALDPVQAPSPLTLGQDLLNMTSEPPALPMVVKFALCHDLHEELNGPDAPQLYTDLKECLDSLELGFDWIRLAAHTTRRPISEHVDAEVLKQFAERVQDSLYDKHEDQALVLSQLLYNTACQSSSCAEIFTNMWDPAVFSACFTASMAKPTLQNLFMAAASRDVALYLRKSGILKTVSGIEGARSADYKTRKLARDIRERVAGWEELQTSSSFAFFVPWVERMLSHEASLGIFILSILSAPSVLDTFSDLPHTTLAFDALGNTDLWALGRALVGVGAVLAALAWADAADEPAAAARTLGVLRFWQARPADYGPLVRRVLLLPRLFAMVDALLSGEHPALDAEAVLLALMADPRSALCPHVWIRATDTEAPQLYAIPRSEWDATDAVTALVCDGLPAAARLLDRADADERRVLFALLIVKDALEEDGRLDVRKRLWEDDLHGLEYIVIETLGSVARALLAQPRTLAAARTSLATAAAALECLPLLVEPDAFPAQATRSLVRAGVTVLAASRTLSRRYPKRLPTVVLDVVNAAKDVLRMIGGIPRSSTNKAAIRALADSLAPNCDTDDPSERLVAVSNVLDMLVPQPDCKSDELAQWVNDVALPVLPQLHAIVRVLDPERKATAIVRLAKLDVDDVGVADWIVTEELRALEQAALTLNADDHHNDEPRAATPDPRIELVRAQVGLAFDWIARVAANSRVKIHWDEKVLARALVALVDADLVSRSGPVVRAARALTAEDASLQFALALVLLSDGAAGLRRAAELLSNMRGEGEPDPPLLAKLSLRVGFALLGLDMDEPTEGAVHSILQWMLDRHNDFEPFVLLGISEHNFSALVASMRGPARALIEDLREQMRFSSSQTPASSAPDLLASVALSQNTLAALFSSTQVATPDHPITTPSVWTNEDVS